MRRIPEFAFDATWATPGDEPGQSDDRAALAADVWAAENKPYLKELLRETAAREPGSGPTVLYQPPLRGEVGYWPVRGLGDILLLYPAADAETVRTLVLEVKASWSEKSSHQIQAAVYSLLVDRLVTEAGLEHEAAAIIHREQGLRELDLSGPNIIETFDLESRITEVRRLLREGGELHEIYETDFEEVGFRLDQKCDGCEFNEICFTKAVEEIETVDETV